MQLKMVLVVFTAFVIFLSFPKVVYANQPIRIEFENDTWGEVRIIYGIHGPSSAPVMTREGNVWVFTILPDDPFFFGDLPQYLRFIDPTNRNHSLTTRFYGSSRISADGQVTTIVPDTGSSNCACDSRYQQIIAVSLERIHALMDNTLPTMHFAMLWQLGLLAILVAFILVLIIVNSLR